MSDGLRNKVADGDLKCGFMLISGNGTWSIFGFGGAVTMALDGDLYLCYSTISDYYNYFFYDDVAIVNKDVVDWLLRARWAFLALRIRLLLPTPFCCCYYYFLFLGIPDIVLKSASLPFRSIGIVIDLFTKLGYLLSILLFRTIGRFYDIFTRLGELSLCCSLFTIWNDLFGDLSLTICTTEVFWALAPSLDPDGLEDWIVLLSYLSGTNFLCLNKTSEFFLLLPWSKPNECY